MHPCRLFFHRFHHGYGVFLDYSVVVYTFHPAVAELVSHSLYAHGVAPLSHGGAVVQVDAVAGVQGVGQVDIPLVHLGHGDGMIM